MDRWGAKSQIFWDQNSPTSTLEFRNISASATVDWAYNPHPMAPLRAARGMWEGSSNFGLELQDPRGNSTRGDPVRGTGTIQEVFHVYHDDPADRLGRFNVDPRPAVDLSQHADPPRGRPDI